MQLGSLVGRYRLQAEVARGGMGAVYRATDSSGQPVAIKFLLAGKAASPLQRRRVATEIQALLRLSHPHVVGLLDAGEHEGVPWLAMEWITGETLGARLERAGPLDLAEVVELIRGLASALDHCHAQGVLHRDLKPDNVLLRAADGAPLLTDFGLSKDLGGEDTSTVLRTAAGRWLGTPGYWPPEQAWGQLEAIGPRSDVYGLGAVLYACLTGLPPQAGETLHEIIINVGQPPRSLRDLHPRMPLWLDRACLRALSIDPAARQASPRELAEQLEAGLAGRLSPGRTARARQGSPVHGGLAVVGASLVIVGALFGVGRLRRLSASTARAPAHSAAPPAGAPGPAGGTLAPVRSASDAASQAQHLALNARVLLERGDLTGARLEIDRAVQLDAANAQAHFLRGLVRQIQRDLVGACADYDHAIMLDPGTPQPYLARGMALEARGDLAMARTNYLRALELDPTNAAAHASNARICALQGEFAAARTSYDRSIGLGPTSQACLERGVLREEHGDPAGAREDFENAIRLDAANARAYYHRGQARQRDDDTIRAREDYDEAIRLDPGFAPAWAARGTLRAAEGDLAGARGDYDRAIELDPRHAQAHHGRGNLIRGQGYPSQARADYDRALELDPRCGPVYRDRGYAYRMEGDLVRAQADYDQALTLDPKDIEALFQRGAVRDMKGDHAGALQDLGRALELDPRNAAGWLKRSGVRWSLGDLRGAIEDAERSLAVSPNFLVAREQLERLRLELPTD